MHYVYRLCLYFVRLEGKSGVLRGSGGDQGACELLESGADVRLWLCLKSIATSPHSSSFTTEIPEEHERAKMSIEGLAMGMRKGPLTKAEVPARVNHAQNKGVSQQCHFNSALCIYISKWISIYIA